jgi:hypothetical protein
MSGGRRIKRGRGGRYRLELPAEERTILKQLVTQLEELLGVQSLGVEDPVLRRLFPPAYTDEPEAEEEYRQLMHDDLLESHRAALGTMTTTLDATELDGDQLSGWLSAINNLRLVLGTKLDVQENDQIEIDPDDPDAPVRAVYFYLSALEEEVVEALAKG